MRCIPCGAEMRVAQVEQDLAMREAEYGTEGWNASAVKRQSDGWPSAATKSRGIFILTPGPRDLAAV